MLQHALLTNLILHDGVLSQVMVAMQSYTEQELWLAGGAISQMIWNYQHKKLLLTGVRDLDIIYFDDKDTSYEAEDAVQQYMQQVYSGIIIEARNQARVHTWFNKKYNTNIRPYTSLLDTLNSNSATVSCIGVRPEGSRLNVYNPYGLQDVFTRTIRPNQNSIFGREAYDSKAESWSSKWSDLTVLPYQDK